MDASELRGILAKPEWTEVEIKKSARAFPHDAASTICSFANSGGGYLILGVDEKLLPSISGIDDDKFDDVQNQCLGLLQGQKKFSCPIEYDPPSIVDVDGALVLVICIQDAKRQNKPVKLFKEKKQQVVYLRKGSRDEVASDEEVARMLIDAGNRGFTDHLLELDVETCLNDKTLKWYRKVYESKHNQKHHELSNVEFLDELGLIREVDGDLKPTRAALLMFGSNKQMSHLLGRNVVDALWYNRSLEGEESEERWADRRPLDDDTPNLFEAWQQLLDRFTYWAESPFEMDESSLQRTKEPPDYLGFREAVVNLLSHQDFSDHNRVPKIEYFKDGSRYWNPGDSLVDNIAQPIGDSASRNPLIMQTFSRISLSDRAGSGLKNIRKNWEQLNRPEPEIIDDKANKSFQLTLGKKPQISELQQQLLERVGVNVNQDQAKVFVASLLQPMSVEQLVITLNIDAAHIYPAIDHLTRQGMFTTSPGGYQAQEHFREPLLDLAIQPSGATPIVDKSDQVTNLDAKTDQPKDILASLTKKQQQLLSELNGELTRQQLMDILGQTHRNNFKNKQLKPLMEFGLVAAKYPDNPNHPNQAYFLTELGQGIKASLAQ